jgi:putative ATPase
MLAAGEDPMALCRRLIRFASEDVGLADPDALRRALAAQQAMAFLGRPEGELALAQVAVDLALAPKSNALYEAWQRAQRDLEEQGPQPVPLQLRNVKTGLDHEALAATRYLNPHRYRHGVVPQAHLPAEFHASSTQLPYYRPSPDGPEACQRARLDDIAAKLAEARELGHGRWLKGQERGSTNHEEIDR